MSEIIEPARGIGVSSFKYLDRDAAWFRMLLARHSIKLPGNSPMERALRAMEDLARAHRGEVELPPDAPDDQFPLMLRECAGTAFLIRALHRASTSFHSELPKQLSIFGGPDVVLTRDAPQSMARDGAWEVLVAALCATFTSQTQFAEPDILCTFRDTQWGLACKIFYSTDLDRQIDCIVEGAKQLEKSSADFGLVVINATNQVNHGKFLQRHPSGSTYGSFREPDVALELLRREVDSVVRRLDGKKLIRRLTQTAQDKSRIKARGILFFAQTTTIVRRMIVPMTQSTLYQFRPFVSIERDFFHAFNRAGQETIGHFVEAITPLAPANAVDH